MNKQGLFRHFDIVLREVRHSLRRDWRESGAGLRRVFACALVAAVHCFLFSGLFELPGLLGPRIEPIMLHEWFALRPDRKPPRSVTIVRLDEPAYAKIGLVAGEKFPRDALAAGIEKIAAAGARLIVLDLIAQRKGTDSKADEHLARALASTPTVIGRYIEIVTDIDENGNKRSRKLHNAPYEDFLDSAKAVVAMNVRLTNGVVQEISLAGEGMVWTDADVPLLEPLQKFVSPEIKQPGRRDFINYYGGPYTLTNVSFAELLDEKPVRSELFKDRVVFVGAATEAGVGIAAGKDTFLTSVSRNPIYGVEIHATVAANLLDQSWIRRLSPEHEVLILTVVAGVLTFYLVSMSMLGCLITAACASAVWLGFSYYSFSNLYLFVPGATLFVVVIPGLVVVRWALEGYFTAKGAVGNSLSAGRAG